MNRYLFHQRKYFLYESKTRWKVAGMYIPLTLLRKTSFPAFKSWFIPLSSDFGSPISLLSERQANRGAIDISNPIPSSKWQLILSGESRAIENFDAHGAVVVCK